MRLFLLLAGLLIAPAASAFTAETPLSDPALEARAQALFHAIRCVVCQGESIADSPADVAADFRKVIRQEIVQGKSDAQVSDYLVSRYGDGILMNTPLKPSTWLLWFGPALMLALAVLAASLYFRRAAKTHCP